ncbi:DUF2431 domain-containing protein [Candidatus Woesearchaeota archaeon]|nr:MAG: DUF2431 domain-containing protein [Candidatus Woesearchaeota archaeon]
MPYKPMLSQKEIEKRRLWQEKVYTDLKDINTERTVTVLNKKIKVLPGVFAPLWGDSLLLAKSVKQEIKKGESVLDVGTGSGIQGIFAAYNGAKVTSVDINESAVRCAKYNAQVHNLAITVFKSDLFVKVKGKFDAIIFNPPFRWFKPRDVLERGELDENYATLQSFFSQVEKYLKNNGKIILVFSSSGDLSFLELLIKKHKFAKKILAKQKLNGWLYVVYKLTKTFK